MDVVLVDDEELTLFLVERRLKGSGLTLKTFSSALAAYRYLDEHTARLLILDLRLPEINGDELLQMLVDDDRLGAARPFICTSARPHRKICQRIEALGATILSKDSILTKHGIESLLVPSGSGPQDRL